MKTCVVTGFAGFIGTHLINELLNNGHEVIGVDNFWVGEYPVKSKRFTLVKGDISNASTWDRIEKLQRNVDFVFHLAGLVGDPACVKDHDLSYNVNVKGTRYCAEFCSKNGAKLIFASSCSLYGSQTWLLSEKSNAQPIDWYGHTKLAGEREIKKLLPEERYILARFATAYGLSNRMRFDLVVQSMCLNAFTKGKLFVDGDGLQRRPLTHCHDLARALVHLMDKNCFGVFNIAGENFRIGDIAKLIKEQINIEIIMRSEMVDWRDYEVDSSKLLNTGFTFESTVKEGIKEIFLMFSSGEFSDFENPKYYNHKLGAQQ